MWLCALPEVGESNLSPFSRLPSADPCGDVPHVLSAQHVSENNEEQYSCLETSYIARYMDRYNVTKYTLRGVTGSWANQLKPNSRHADVLTPNDTLFGFLCYARPNNKSYGLSVGKPSRKHRSLAFPQVRPWPRCYPLET